MWDAVDRAAPLSATDRTAALGTLVPLHALGLPRDVESDPRRDEIRRALVADVRRLWAGGVLEVAGVRLTDPLRAALATPSVSSTLVRGLETAATTLAAERRGLDALAPAVAARQGRRVSRVMLVSSDGAERFYRQVERLAIAHAPRVLVCLVAATSAELGGLLYGSGAAAKLVLTGRKDAATSVLRSLAATGLRYSL